LILTGHAEEGLFYLQQAKKNYTEKDDYTYWKFFQNFILLEAIASAKINSDINIDELFIKINPTQFYFLRKSFSNILYLLLLSD
jgi:hypothetical protein